MKRFTSFDFLLLITLVLLFVFQPPVQLYAQEDTKYKKYFEMSLEDLMNVKVYSATKTFKKVGDAPSLTCILKMFIYFT